MQKVFGLTASFILIGCLLVSCAGGISEQVRAQVNYFGPFAPVQKDPAKYQGDTVLWGGKVIETQVKGSATDLVVLQLELDSRDRPQDNDQSQGRFLIRSSQFMDPALYPQGTLITVAGRLQGAQTRLIGQMPYQYPVIEPIEIKKWPVSGPAPPRFQFGIGIGTSF